MQHPQHILITGASSGLGKALALAYAAPGITLSLTGRDNGRLAAVKSACEAKGAEVGATTTDVRDVSTMATFLQKRHAQKPIDLAIANAGISAGTAGGHSEPSTQTSAIFATNVQGVLNTLEPLIPLMSAHGKGQLAIVSSLAGFKGLPSAPAYCASKAAARFIGEAWRPLLKPHNIQVNVICPGFIKTRMTDVNDFPMPFLMTAPKAAVLIQRRLAANHARIAFPWPLYFSTWLLGLLPPAWLDAALGKLPGKR